MSSKELTKDLIGQIPESGDGTVFTGSTEDFANLTESLNFYCPC